MAILKCKMCGGTLEFEEGETVAVCDSCGTKQTVPNVDDEKKAKLYERANKLRAASEFDKAETVYENIVNDFPDDAESYWGILLCRYGIEYVDDPITGKKVPTCHRSSFESIMDDADFDMVMENADPVARNIYREEAKQIEEIRKRIIEISGKEKPYDIFICYKETGENGDRTLDSVLAQDAYEALTDKGYRVFFSRISLEDKLGTEYEPFIFAALNSAKVMLAFGTSYDNYNAIWVKNEWGRFLNIMEGDKEKVIIPCFKDIDAYDIPKEFKRFQAQDMGKVGAIQDLVRGIDKIFGKRTGTEENVHETGKNATGIDPLLKRVFMFLEDGAFNEADQYCERVLDQDPENPQAYLGKLMAELKIRKQADLRECEEPFDKSNNYVKVIRFGEPDLVGELEDCNKYIREGKGQSFIKLGFSALKAGDFYRAYSSFGKALNIDAKCGQAYWGKFLCDLKASNVDMAIMAIGKKIDCKKTTETIILPHADIATIARKADGGRGMLDVFTDQEINEILPDIKIKSSVKSAETYYREIADKLDTAILAEIVGNSDMKCAIKYADAEIREEFDRIIIGVKAFALNRSETERNLVLEEGEQKAAREEISRILSEAEARQDIKIDKLQAEIADLKGMFAGRKKKELEDSISALRKNKKIIKYFIKPLNAGSKVSFGKYPMEKDGTEKPLSWIILDVKDDSALIISEYGIDALPYMESPDYSQGHTWTWETCTLRKWMNGDFICKAFNKEEKMAIQSVTVPADNNPCYDTDPGNGTVDKIFLLSYKEAAGYFASDEDRKCAMTDYAKNRGAANFSDSMLNGKKCCGWWLRSPGYDYSLTADVSEEGFIHCYGSPVTSRNNAVRPACWVDLEKLQL